MRGAGFLRDLGFEHAGRWSITQDRLRLTLDRNGERTPALYAFVVDGEIKYVGKTARLLRTRLQGYATPGPTQATNRRIYALLCEAVAKNQLVEIWSLVEWEPCFHRTLPLDVPAGLESTLIDRLKPTWNVGR